MWTKVQSTLKPEETDTTSSSEYNYIRKDISETTQKNEDGTELKMYEYDELKVKKDQYYLYLQLQKNSASIDYMAMMSDISLGDE
jgi:hypothetical protein